MLAPSLARAGGIQRYTATLLRAVEELLGHESVRCVAMPKVLNHGVTDSRRLPGRSKIRFAWKALWEATRWRPDLIICTHLALGPVGWFAAGFGGRPYWVVVHGIEAWGVLPRWKHAALRRAGKVIVTSAFNREQVVKRHQIEEERIASLPCALDETLLNMEPARDGLNCHLSDDRRVVLSVARMAAVECYKGHEIVLQALASVAAKVPNVTYIIVGDGDDRARLESLAKQLGVATHVVFTGEVSDAELASIYRRSEIFVLPARTVIDDHHPKGEGFGIVFLEAMAFGKAVVGPNYGAPAELIGPGIMGLLVDPESPASVADALLNLLTNPDSAREMGRIGSEWVREHYSYGCFRERLRELMMAD